MCAKIRYLIEDVYRECKERNIIWDDKFKNMDTPMKFIIHGQAHYITYRQLLRNCKICNIKEGVYLKKNKSKDYCLKCHKNRVIDNTIDENLYINRMYNELMA